MKVSMKTLNWIFTLSSINLILVCIERFSVTTKILLQPYNFLRLHELLQITTLILFTVILPVFILKEVTNNFAGFKTKHGFLLFLIFITGVYFYATGNGIHEVSSFNFNNFCNTKVIENTVCGSFFFNDYYTGNILFFIGAAFMSISLIIFEKRNATISFNKKDLTILSINAIIYSLAIFAYAAFDTVHVGFIYAVILTVVSGYFFWTVRKNYAKYPLITYTFIAYTLGTVASLFPRFF